MLFRKLSVNIDHIATLRNARGTTYPSILAAASICELGGADSITFHLREDRRHIKDMDVKLLKDACILPLHFEMAATSEMAKISLSTSPEMITLVPEKRKELTTEGGLNVRDNIVRLGEYIKPFKGEGIKVSLFIEPSCDDIELSKEIGADIVELHTGTYCNLRKDKEISMELDRIKEAALFARGLGLGAHAGHGIYYDTIRSLALIKEIDEFSIGHGIIARAVLSGLENAIRDMKALVCLA